MKLLGKINSYDKILGYLKNPDAELTSLTLHEQKKLERITKAHSLIQQYLRTSDAAAILMKLYPEISRATAYRDCSDATAMFGDITKSTKEGIRHLAGELVLEGAAIARIKNNETALIAAGRELANVHGVNNNDPDIIDWSQVEPHQYQIALPETAIKAIQTMIAKGHIDLSSLVNEMANQAEDAQIVEEDNE